MCGRRTVSVATAAGVAVAVAVGAAAAARRDAPRPSITAKPIPYGAERRAQMAAYAKRHYGLATWRLRPRVVVQHYTASSSFSSAWATFAANVADPELHELPGVCAHFVIDRDGMIYQLVSTRVMCRHTVGLNHVSIGIEHVGLSDREILGNRRQLAASLRLTVWLMSRHGIELRNVIGHNESRTSPYHYERYASWRCQTHGDFTKPTMDVYRGRLRGLARRYRVRIGPAARPRATRC